MRRLRDVHASEADFPGRMHALDGPPLDGRDLNRCAATALARAVLTASARVFRRQRAAAVIAGRFVRRAMMAMRVVFRVRRRLLRGCRGHLNAEPVQDEDQREQQLGGCA